MADNELLKNIKQLHSVLLQADGQVPLLTNLVNSFSHITNTATMVIDNQGKVLAGNIDCPDAGGYFKRILEIGSIAGETQLQKANKKGQPVENELLTVKKVDGAEDK